MCVCVEQISKLNLKEDLNYILLQAMELHRWKLEEEQKLEEAQMSEEAALALAEKEKTKCKAAIEAAEASQRIAELEAQKRVHAEMKAQREAEERRIAIVSLSHEIRYRKYTIEEIETATEDFAESRKIGEGGYGPVYRGELEHTPVAIKVLRPDAAQGRSQFQQEVTISINKSLQEFLVLEFENSLNISWFGIFVPESILVFFRVSY